MNAETRAMVVCNLNVSGEARNVYFHSQRTDQQPARHAGPGAFGVVHHLRSLLNFDSFTLETLAFLATWFVIDAVLSVGRNLLLGNKSAPTG